MASCNRATGTRKPISIQPSPTGNVSSKIKSLVKLRMEKLSSHLIGQGSNSLPCWYWMEIFR